MNNNKLIPEILKNKKNIVLDKEMLDKLKGHDIIVKKISYETEYDEEGNQIKRRKIKKVNLTKKINETKKLIKENTAAKKLAELEEIFNSKE